MLYEAKRDTRAARRSFERVLELQPDSDVALAGLVSADLAEKNPAVRPGADRGATGEKPQRARLVMMSGMAYMAVRDLPKAEAAYRRLLELDANNIDAYSRLRRHLPPAESPGGGEKELRGNGAAPWGAGRRRKRCSEPSWSGRARSAEARGHFERAVQLNPRAAVAANNLAWDYANNGGNLDVALQLAQTAKKEASGQCVGDRHTGVGLLSEGAERPRGDHL